MESTRNSMDPRDNEKHEEEHEDSKKERRIRTTSHSIKNHKITSRYELTKSNQAEELKVMMKNNVRKTYE
jgi:hypothetical protein